MAKKQPEAVFRDRIKPQLKALPNSWWTRIEQTSICGTPDTLGVIAGTFVALEFKKSEADKPTPLQMHNLQSIADSGGVAAVVCPENWDYVYNILAKLAYGDGAPSGQLAS